MLTLFFFSRMFYFGEPNRRSGVSGRYRPSLSMVSFHRNLEKPIGALNEQKLERYLENEECQQTDKYLYGSFFSTSLFVFFYLVRLEPYSTMGTY